MAKYCKNYIQRRKFLLAGVASPVLAAPVLSALAVLRPLPTPGIVIRDGWILADEDR